jgi:hypothetical protein
MFSKKNVPFDQPIIHHIRNYHTKDATSESIQKDAVLGLNLFIIFFSQAK